MWRHTHKYADVVRLAPVAAFGLLGFLLAAGCSSHGGSGSTTPAKPLSWEEFQTALPGAFCDYNLRCQRSPSFDRDLCIAMLEPLLDPLSLESAGSLKAEVMQGKATLIPEKAQACLDAIAQFDCQATFDAISALPACQAAFTGTVMMGDACITSLECASGLFCVSAAGMPAGACVATCEPRGTACNVDGDCKSGQRCDSTRSCVTDPDPPGVEGQPCNAAGACQSGLGCFSTADHTHLCQKPHAVGEPCGSAGDCQPGLSCGSEGNCAQPTPAMDGQSCTTSIVPACAAGSVCLTQQAGGWGVCGQLKKRGDSCAQSYECGGYFSPDYCDATTSTCVARPSSGDCPMGQSLCNPGKSWCDASVSPPQCKPYRALGEQCQNSTECGPPVGAFSCAATSGGPTTCRYDSSHMTCTPPK